MNLGSFPISTCSVVERFYVNMVRVNIRNKKVNNVPDLEKLIVHFLLIIPVLPVMPSCVEKQTKSTKKLICLENIEQLGPVLES